MATTKEIRSFFDTVYAKSNRVIEIIMFAYFGLGILLSFFYDTFLVGVGVGVLNLALYFGARTLFGNSRRLQYVASLVFGIFMAQFIYQMHGLFEMHFTAFIAIIAMITYQNKYAFIPQALFVVVHHSSFAYVQYLGVVNDNEAFRNIYFTQLEFMDFQTFLFHAGLYAAGVALAAVYSHNLEQHTIQNAENILQMRDNEKIMLKNVEIANQIASGNLDTEMSVTDGDTMGSALLEMRNSLKQSADREKEEKFINVGVAEIGEIIRSNEGNLDELSFQVIAYLVRYLGANQGAMFVRMEDEGEEFLELKGCYAYDRKKFIEKRIAPGDGIVGQCYLEKEYILLKEIPEGYINITSGLGKATPDVIVIMPVKTEQIIEGVIEIASFGELEQYKVDFLRKASENLASVIASAKINEQTKKLFEKSQEQTEMLRAQDEEMRQNMEELSATQEEMQRKTQEFENRFNALHHSNLCSMEFDREGNVISLNPAFARLSGRQAGEAAGLHHDTLLPASGDNASHTFKEILSQLVSGEKAEGTYTWSGPGGTQVSTYGSYTVLREKDADISSILFFGMPNAGERIAAKHKIAPEPVRTV